MITGKGTITGRTVSRVPMSGIGPIPALLTRPQPEPDSLMLFAAWYRPIGVGDKHKCKFTVHYINKKHSFLHCNCHFNVFNNLNSRNNGGLWCKLNSQLSTLCCGSYWFDFDSVDFIEYTLCVSAAYDYCQWETFEASCKARDQLVVMKSAVYGRMASERCIERNYGYVGCHQDVLHQADMRCSGRRECKLDIPYQPFEVGHPCPRDLTRFLRASFECVKGEINVVFSLDHNYVTLHE